MSDPTDKQQKSTRNTSPSLFSRLGFLIADAFLAVALAFLVASTQQGKLILVYAAGLGALLAVLVAFVQTTVGHRRAAQRQQRSVQNKREQLQHEHPEMYLLLEILEFNDAASGGRSFWSSIGQNLFFLGIGIALPLIFAHLHLFQ